MSVRHRWINALVLGLISTAAAPLTSAQPSADPRLERLYRTFIAPCCWSKNLMEHNSQAAADMRNQIDFMVRSGRSDDEIKAVFVQKYGRRILALPEGTPRLWLFWTPVAAVSAGMMLLLAFVVRARSRALADCDNLPQDRAAGPAVQ
jgi:cytochrome c-type biogenesis protein CcmH